MISRLLTDARGLITASHRLYEGMYIGQLEVSLSDNNCPFHIFYSTLLRLLHQPMGQKSYRLRPIAC